MTPITHDGKTALYHIRGLQENMSVVVNGKTYIFKPRGGVGLAWVDNADVGGVLAIRRKCCGGKLSPEFAYANSSQADYWVGLNGGSYE